MPFDTLLVSLQCQGALDHDMTLFWHSLGKREFSTQKFMLVGHKLYMYTQSSQYENIIFFLMTHTL